MEYFIVFKTDKKNELEEVLSLIGGYTFRQKISITLYNRAMIEYILTKKMNKSLRNIINSYLLCENDSDDEDNGEQRVALMPKIETLRNVLLEKYARFLGVETVESYLIKLEKMEGKLQNKKNKKSRTR